MSADPDKGAAYAIGDKVTVFAEGDPSHVDLQEKKKKNRSVRFPTENQLVTEYFEPANPWHDVPTTTRAQLAQEYLLSCRRHNTPPIDSVLHQIRELPENSIGGGTRAARLGLADCSLEGAAPADALESLLRKVQFRRIELDHAEVDDEGAEALFDMIEYYESARVICITGPRQFGIRGWQAASRMIKKSAELSEIEVAESALEPSHAPVLARALRPHTCRLRALCLQRAQLSGEALMSLGVGHLADALVEQSAQTPPSSATSPISPQLYPHLRDNRLCASGLQALCGAMRDNHTLTQIDLDDPARGGNRSAADARHPRALSPQRAARDGAGTARPQEDQPHLPHRLRRQGDTANDNYTIHTRSRYVECPIRRIPVTPLSQYIAFPLCRVPVTTQFRYVEFPMRRMPAMSLSRYVEFPIRRVSCYVESPQRRIPVTPHSQYISFPLGRVPATSQFRYVEFPMRRMPAMSLSRYIEFPIRCIPATSHTRYVAFPLRRVPATSHSRYVEFPLRRIPATSHSRYVEFPLRRIPATSSSRYVAFPLRRVPATPHSRYVSFPLRRVSATSTSCYGESPWRRALCKVVEPPSIQVHPAKRASRFSVSRNYDSIYNPSPRGSPSASPTPPISTPSPSDTHSPKADPVETPTPKSTSSGVESITSQEISNFDYGMENISKPYEAVPSCTNLTNTGVELSTSSSTIGFSTSSIDVTRTRDYIRDTRYSDSPSITTLSGVLFSRTAPMSTTTAQGSESYTKTGAAGSKFEANVIKASPEMTAVSSVDITKSPPTYFSSSSESVLGTASVESLVSPTVVLNSRFSISPSPVRTSAIENFLINPQERKSQEKIQTQENRATVIPQANIRKDNFSPKTHLNSEINEPTTIQETNIPEAIYGSSIGSQSIDNETIMSSNIVSTENVPPVVTCDMKSVSADVPSYTGDSEKLIMTEVIPTGIDNIIKTKEITDLTINETISIKPEKEELKSEQNNRFVAEVRPEDTQPCIDVTSTSRPVNTEQSLHIQIENTPKMHYKPPLTTEHQNVPKMGHNLVSKEIGNVSGIHEVIEKGDTASKHTEKTNEKLASENFKAVDFACKPEDVIFFISDEPISYSDKVVDSDAKDSIKSVGKTYSDVVKSDPYKDKSEQLTYEQQIDDELVKTETKLVKNSIEVSDSDRVDVQVEVTVKTESVKDNAAKVHSDKDFVNIDDILIRKDDKAMKKIEAITEDLGNLIQEMKDMSSKGKKKCTVDIGSLDTNIVPGSFNRDVVLKKNKSESSLDSPDLEVSRLMNKKCVGSPFRDSSSSLEISLSSMESLNAIENAPKPIIIQEFIESDTELDRRKGNIALSTESSVESTSEATPVNTHNFLNMSLSSNESVSPLIFGKNKKIHGSLSSLEASVSSLDSKQDKIMVTSADSGIEHSLQNPSEFKEDASSNEGTLTHNSSLRETVKRTESLQETLTSSPKRTSSLLDVPALKSKGLDRMRKISWVAPSPSFHIPRVEPDKVRDEKPSHLEKLLSLFQHPTSLFSRSQSDDERKSASNTPPRKDSSLTSSFWSWGSAIENYKEEREDSSEATDSTLSERVQVSFVDESFSKKLDSKTPSTDTDNTLSEFQSFPQNVVTDNTTDLLVQKCLDLSLNTDNVGSTHGEPITSDMIDLSKPNDTPGLDKNTDMSVQLNENKVKLEEKEEVRLEPMRPRSFAAVLIASGSENSLDKQASPSAGPLVDKLPVKVIRGIKENVSPENTLTSSMTNTQALASEMALKQQPIVNALWEVSVPLLEKREPKKEELKSDLAPIATIEETCDIAADNFNTETIQLAFIDDVKVDIEVRSSDDQIVPDTSLEDKDNKVIDTVTKGLDNVDLGKDALSYLMYETQDFEPDAEHAVATKVEEGSLAQELKEAAIKEMMDLSPELVIDQATEVFPAVKPESSPGITDRAKIKKSNSLEDLSQRQEKGEKSPKAKSIAFKVPETLPCDIPERRSKLRSRSGSSPKSLPESLNKPCPIAKMDSILYKKKKKVSSLGKIARDSLLALNMSEEEIAEFRRSYKLTSVESLRSLESVSEDANSQSGTSFDSRCRACLRTSQESLMSLDSITEDCKCADRDKPRSMR
ncbi:Cysteine proteinase inhibitor [Operophtera brumata]|uniref:Cysteine proteinase inhibitor n=1 Tax=Operophtera brumata TaxID=104452 RepID=A0A0L7LMG6_OPEBR|nr:Cysteine proteinase inhibitor [Operophtera brumata]